MKILSVSDDSFCDGSVSVFGLSWFSLVLLLPGSMLADESVLIWHPYEIELSAQRDHDWWEFPAQATFHHQDGSDSLIVEPFWDGARRWIVRVAFPKAGMWSWETHSEDPGLSGKTGTVEVIELSKDQLAANPNLRGLVRIASDRRHFEYADGTACLILADTLWAGNTARCGLGTEHDGPFFTYLADRRSKGFNTVLMQYFHGYGDYPDSPGHRNEGGKPYLDIDHKDLNPAHFRALDIRLQALWDHGFVAAIPTTWWGKTKNCVFSPEDAQRMSAYCAVRYGAYNAIWSLSGEYQYAFNDCHWRPDDITALGKSVQRHNPFQHPLSIHPSGQVTWSPPHNVQSSLPFHGESWLDHHWLQTGQSVDRMHNIVIRLAENRALEPALPVFCSESYYERGDDPDRAYHARWQIWTASLNGAAGYGYGAQGMWQFLDSDDPLDETGKKTAASIPWREAIEFPGSKQVQHARTLLESIEWWTLRPRSDAVLVNGKPNVLPSANDLTPPQAALIGNSWVIYVPRGNEASDLSLKDFGAQEGSWRWFDPRTGKFVSERINARAGVIPPRPEPSTEDWVLVSDFR